MKDKTAAGLLAFFLGYFGVHKFYLGQTGAGIIYLLLCWCPIIWILAIIDGVMLLTMDENQFQARFNTQQYYQSLPGRNAPQTVIIQTGTEKGQSNASDKSIAEQLESLHRLKTIGALTEEEYQIQKQKILRTTSSFS